MRTYYLIIAAATVGLVLGGCNVKEFEYGRFTEEEVADMEFAKVSGLPQASGGLTMSVMGEIITADEIIGTDAIKEKFAAMEQTYDFKSFAKQARPIIGRLVMTKVSDILIYQLAKKESPANIDEMLDKAVEKEVEKHVAVYGNNYAKAEEAFNKMGFADWEEFKGYKKKLILTQTYISKQVKNDQPITHGKMVARYNELKDEFFNLKAMVKIRIIEINSDKLAADEIDTASGENAEEAAIRKAKEIAGMINDGGDFAELAEKYSHGNERKNGGLWADVTVGSLNEPYDVLEDAAVNMAPGEVSGVIMADGYAFILKLVDKRGASVVPFEDVQDRIESEIRLMGQRSEYNRVMSDIVKQANIKDLEIFTNFCTINAFEKLNKIGTSK